LSTIRQEWIAPQIASHSSRAGVPQPHRVVAHLTLQGLVAENWLDHRPSVVVVDQVPLIASPLAGQAQADTARQAHAVLPNGGFMGAAVDTVRVAAQALAQVAVGGGALLIGIVRPLRAGDAT
jgi:hypothetical protein